MLPEEIPEDVAEVLGHIVRCQDAMNKAEDWLEVARADRNRYIGELRGKGWTVKQVAAYTQMSTAAIMKISAQLGITSTRGTREGLPR